MALPLAILGSARQDGDTAKAVAMAFPDNSAGVVFLPDYRIGGYDYDHNNQSDDFTIVAEAMQKADHIIFATPVYWYAMSAPLKFFFDRLTDLTENLKPTGKALAGKSVWLIATGTDPGLPEGFEVPFRRTAEYFAMAYRGGAYLHTGDNAGLRASHEVALAAFGAAIRNSQDRNTQEKFPRNTTIVAVDEFSFIRGPISLRLPGAMRRRRRFRRAMPIFLFISGGQWRPRATIWSHHNVASDGLFAPEQHQGQF